MPHREHVRSAPTSLSLRTEECVAYAGVKNELKFSIPEMPGCGSTDRELQRGHSPGSRGMMDVELMGRQEGRPKGWLSGIWWASRCRIAPNRRPEAAGAAGGLGTQGHSFGQGGKFTCRRGACEICGEPFGDFGAGSMEAGGSDKPPDPPHFFLSNDLPILGHWEN